MQIASYYTQIYLNEVKNELKHDKHNGFQQTVRFKISQTLKCQFNT